MTPDELDRALEEALDVEPPVGFVARVRARVAADQAASAGRHVWWPVGALAVAVLVAAAGGLMLERSDPALPAATVTSRDGRVPAEGAYGKTAAPARQAAGNDRATGDPRVAGGLAEVAVSRPPRARSADTADIARPADALPAVLISPDDAAGVRLFATFAEAALPAPATSDGDEATRQISRIEVVPIEVDLLPELPRLALGELQ